MMREMPTKSHTFPLDAPSDKTIVTLLRIENNPLISSSLAALLACLFFMALWAQRTLEFLILASFDALAVTPREYDLLPKSRHEPALLSKVVAIDWVARCFVLTMQ